MGNIMWKLEYHSYSRKRAILLQIWHFDIRKNSILCIKRMLVSRYTVRPNTKETQKSSYFSIEIESFIKYYFHCYKVQFIFFHLTPKMSCYADAWPSKNNVKFQCQNQVARNKGLRSVIYVQRPSKWIVH